ncbi:hypothetical protein CRUP_015695 [Coryphaenoides rupestris]|nr:hypothetical protein CRUP_015695 [Coryphaenoides rupestris]
MTNKGDDAYDSRDIVERYLHDNQVNKGLAREVRLASQHSGKRLSSSAASSPTTSSSSSSSSSLSSAGSVKPRRRVLASSSGEEGDSHEDSPVAQRQQHGVRSRVQTRRSRLQEVLQRAGAELDSIYQRDFLSQVSAHFLHLTPEALRTRLRAIAGELFVDGVNWGRVVAMLEFGAAICTESAATETRWSCEDVAAWMDAFVELYDRARPPGGCWSIY